MWNISSRSKRSYHLARSYLLNCWNLCNGSRLRLLVWTLRHLPWLAVAVGTLIWSILRVRTCGKVRSSAPCECNWVVGKTEISTSRSRHFWMKLIFRRFRKGSGSFVGADTRKPRFGLYLRVHRGSASLIRHPRRNYPVYHCPRASYKTISSRDAWGSQREPYISMSAALHTLEFPSKRPKHRTHSRSPMDSVAGNWHVRHARRSELKWVSLIWFIERVILFSDFLPFESYYALSLVWLREVESEGMQLLHPPFKNLRCTLTPNILLCEWSTNIRFYPSRSRRKPILVRVNLRSGKGEIKGVEQNQHCLE